MVHTFHGHVLDAYFGQAKTFIFQFIERYLAKITDSIVAISNTQKWELSKKYKVAESSKISLINLGFDLKPFIHAHISLKESCVRKLVFPMTPFDRHRRTSGAN
jgi:hypothetical protein